MVIPLCVCGFACCWCHLQGHVVAKYSEQNSCKSFADVVGSVVRLREFHFAHLAKLSQLMTATSLFKRDITFKGDFCIMVLDMEYFAGANSLLFARSVKWHHVCRMFMVFDENAADPLFATTFLQPEAHPRHWPISARRRHSRRSFNCISAGTHPRACSVSRPRQSNERE